MCARNVSARQEGTSWCTVCVWFVLAARVTRGVRPGCMAWFLQCADESWQLQDCLPLPVLWIVPDHTCTAHCIYGNSKVWCLYLHAWSSRQNIPALQSRMFLLGGPSLHPPVLSFFFSTTTCLQSDYQARPESVFVFFLGTSAHENICYTQHTLHKSDG